MVWIKSIAIPVGISGKTSGETPEASSKKIPWDFLNNCPVTISMSKEYYLTKRTSPEILTINSETVHSQNLNFS